MHIHVQNTTITMTSALTVVLSEIIHQFGGSNFSNSHTFATHPSGREFKSSTAISLLASLLRWRTLKGFCAKVERTVKALLINYRNRLAIWHNIQKLAQSVRSNSWVSTLQSFSIEWDKHRRLIKRKERHTQTFRERESFRYTKTENMEIYNIRRWMHESTIMINCCAYNIQIL